MGQVRCPYGPKAVNVLQLLLLIFAGLGLIKLLCRFIVHVHLSHHCHQQDGTKLSDQVERMKLT